MEIWSNTIYSYDCLLDFNRTKAFQAAIRAVVKEGAIVLDAGAGTGILSFFAAEAGAKKVYAVEVDPIHCKWLRQSIEANSLGDRIEVIAGDILTVPLPEAADVFICEMMDTALIDEMQVSAINALRQRGVLTQRATLLTWRYETFVELYSARF